MTASPSSPSRFKFIGKIEPETDGNGHVHEFMPQPRYHNLRNLSLHRYGSGPFCRFRIPNVPRQSGVYSINVDGGVMHIGETVDLAERFGPRGYGAIQPRNCYFGGQQANCRINHLILLAAKEGRKIELFFYATDDRIRIERELRRKACPPWNLV
jgi:hypothetical protein